MAKRGKRAKEKSESEAGKGTEAGTLVMPATTPGATLPTPAPSAAAAPTANAAPKGVTSSSPTAALQASVAVSQGEAARSPAPATDRLIIGWLREHGPAQHAFRSKAEPSYFLKLRTREGEQFLWGKGLERALATSRTRPQVGDEIGVREIEIRPIVASRGPPGGEGAVPTVPAPRTHWVIERTAFFAERAAAAQALRDTNTQPREAIRNHPDLIGAYFTLDAARKVAEVRIGHPESRERFVTLVRETLAHAIERGEPIAQPRNRGARQVKAREEALSTSRAGELERTR